MGQRARGLVGTGAVLVIVSLALCPAAAPAAQLGPAPIQADCLVYRGKAPCLYNIGFIEMRLSKHILHVGDKLTADYSWGLTPTRGASLLKSGVGLRPVKGQCKTPVIAQGSSGSSTCTWKAVKPTGGWVTSLGINLGQVASLGSYTENDYYAIIGKEPAIEGWVRRKDSTTKTTGFRPGVPNVQVKINGPRFGRSIRTNDNGYFFTTVQKAGKYRVTPVLTKKLKDGKSNSVAIDPESKVVSVSDNQVGRAEFEIRDAIKVTATATPSSAPADGFHTAKVDISVERFGDPVPSAVVSVLPNKESVGADPNAVPIPARYCSSAGGLLWPNVNRGVIHTDAPFDLYTDDKGKASFNLQLGTIPGKLAVRVWVKDSSGKLQTDSINDARADVTIDNTGPGTNGLPGFGVTYGQLLTTGGLEPGSSYVPATDQLAKLAVGSKLAGLAFASIYGSGMTGTLVIPQGERVTVGENNVIGANNGVVLTPDRVAAALQTPYGTYASLVKAGALPDLVPFADWATGTSSAAGWSLLKQDGVIHFLGGWEQLGYPYTPQPGGC